MRVVVREANPRDAGAVSSVQVSSWRAAYRGIVPDAFLDSMEVDERAERWRDGMVERPGGQITYLAHLDEVATGFGAVGACRDPGATGVGELYAIYVLPEYWRCGIGRALHTACLEGLRSQGYDEARLWVLEANPQARAFYEQLDWRWDGTTELHGFGDVELPIVRYCRALN
jgi:ribosomal protein S18 acetylase RimI-like enzyme